MDPMRPVDAMHPMDPMHPVNAKNRHLCLPSE
jgi:hypothetical protein